MEERTRVSLIMGSISDKEIVKEAEKVLKYFGITYDKRVFSCHRSLNLLNSYVKEAEERGVEIFLCFAGMAAALPGIVASITSLPVVACALDSGFLGGIDALLSIVRLPRYVSCATTGVGKSGAVNAALFVIKILALRNSSLRKKLSKVKEQKENEIRQINRKLK